MTCRKNGWSCLDCARSTRALGEYYMVHDHVWAAAFTTPVPGMLCLGCLSERLGRPLTTEDFTDAPLNQDPRIRRSERLRGLLGPIVWSPERWARRKPERSKPKKPEPAPTEPRTVGRPALPPEERRVGRMFYLSPEAQLVLEALPPGGRSRFVERAILAYAESLRP